MNTLLKYIGYQVKLLPAANIVVCLLITVSAPLIFSLKMLSFREAADIGELYISLTGFILLPSLCFTGKDAGTAGVVCSKRENPAAAQAVRLLMGLLVLAVCCAAYTSSALLQGSTFDAVKIASGVFITACATGMLGYTAGTLIGNLPLAYLLPFAWYGLEFFTRGKYTKELYLFSLRTGEFTKGKMILGAIAAGMVLVNIIYMVFCRNRLRNT